MSEANSDTAISEESYASPRVINRWTPVTKRHAAFILQERLEPWGWENPFVLPSSPTSTSNMELDKDYSVAAAKDVEDTATRYDKEPKLDDKHKLDDEQKSSPHQEEMELDKSDSEDNSEDNSEDDSVEDSELKNVLFHLERALHDANKRVTLVVRLQDALTEREQEKMALQKILRKVKFALEGYRFVENLHIKKRHFAEDSDSSDGEYHQGHQEPIDWDAQQQHVEEVHEQWLQDDTDTFFFLETNTVDVEIGEDGPGPSTQAQCQEKQKQKQNELHCTLDEEDEDHIYVNYKGAGKTIGTNNTVHQRWKDLFANKEESFDDANPLNDILPEAEAPGNPFAPFVTEMDWRVARWVVQDGIGHKSFDRFLEIPGLWEKLGLSFKNIREIHQTIDNDIPDRAGIWKTEDLFFDDAPDVPYTIRYRDPLEAVRSLWGDPSLAKHLVYRPQKVFTDEDRMSCVYTEMWTGDWWNGVQKKLPKGATVAPVIIATDKTQLTQFSGGKSAYPVYLTLGNIPKSIRQKPSKRACILLGYLPSTSKLKVSNLSKKNISIRNQQLFHEAMRIILEPLIEAGKKGVEMTGRNGEISGPERKHMARILLGCLGNKYRAHDEDTLKYIRGALHTIHHGKVGNGKMHLIEGLLRKDMNIPKLHSFLHYEDSIRLFGTTDNYNTEMFERFHIDFAKEGFRTSNQRDVFPQMVNWLARREKVSMFDSYLEVQDCLTKPRPKKKRKITERTTHGIAEHPPFPNRPLSLIEKQHHAPNFSQDLKVYLNKYWPHPSSNRTAHLYALPFDRLDVFIQFKFHPHLLHDDIANPDEEESDTVKAHPCTLKNPNGHFDTVVALHTEEAQSEHVLVVSV
ncbi:unnamed protein product [Cyclocybe aegerita]|uniref:Uncharacterized protein n=1 Tax=Cyclocybe aegerita TaxID=1973307 RepID=A0A8S0WS96_CYCAE|nr:unnamed protein product [Cyclocybe aegerita]